ncbi:copper resistance protein CopC [Paenibacillus sp. XY044]|uniref:copper resistance CopC family protein n=1 Tax=Paenibacillus sp. XY044 TaxID=2026089 RepID=UPI000B9941EE|nr:copper resistance protein CopC [Paenibacillus sp. XY044]OZB91301.1 hypothetical protein CJP46_28865 [Paenibacillus sp. XY044]
MRRFMSYIVFGILAFMLTIPSMASAHSKLEASKPSANELVKTDVKQIELTFNTNIEVLSSFTVKNSSNEKFPINHLKVNDMEMTGTLDKPLEDGDYTVDWKIVGKDGHPITGSYVFQVKKTAVEQNSSPVTVQQENNDQEHQDAPASKPVYNQHIVNYGIGAGIIIVVILIFLFMKRRRRG